MLVSGGAGVTECKILSPEPDSLVCFRKEQRATVPGETTFRLQSNRVLRAKRGRNNASPAHAGLAFTTGKSRAGFARHREMEGFFFPLKQRGGCKQELNP